jgi:hypothetical protein
MECTKQQNHDKAKVGELLMVPHYANLLNQEVETSEDEDALSSPQSLLVKS